MRKITLLVFAIILCVQSYGQVSVPGTPPSFTQNMSKNITTYYLPSVDVQKMLQEDDNEQKLDKSQPMRFGKDFNVHLSLQNTGTWTTLSNGDRIWRLKVASKDAKSVNFLFSSFYMPQGAEFYIYNEDRTYQIGAFTSSNNKSHGEFSTAPVKGKTVILEYFEPKAAQGQGSIVISSIVHAYRDMFAYAQNTAKDFGDSGSCNIDVACAASAGWENEVKSVTLIMLANNTRWCSGAMINNTLQDQTPYFLTANHCLGGNPNTWIFVFNYESPTCNGVDGSLAQSISGSVTRSTNAASDFALLELSTIPPTAYNAFYAGWNNANVAPVGATGIHHPSGDVKKICFDNGPLVLGSSFSTTNHWRVSNWEQGTTEPGSSGSPLFDPNHRIVGQLHGGQASCSNVTYDEYGKFATSWLGGGTPGTSLQSWLDPSNSVVTLNGNAFLCGAYALDAMATDTNATLTWDASIDTITDFMVRYREVGVATWTTISIADTNLVYGIDSLTACTDYEFQIDMNCDTAWSGFTASFVFTTDGCCEAPSNIVAASITDTTAIITGTSVLAALSYDMRYREVGGATWTTVTGLTTVSYNLTGLIFCTDYEVEWRTICAATTTAWAGTTFTTSCGNCVGLPYCATDGASVDDEWIEEVIVNTISNNSGVATSGYTDFTNISTMLVAGQTYPISLSQGYSGQAWDDYFSVWIDYDQSGTFDAAELAYNSGVTTTFPNTGNITIPFTALNGATRMRVSMQYNGAPLGCGTYPYGETEDYCVNINNTGIIPCLSPNNIQSANVTTSSADLNWDTAQTATAYDVRYRIVGAATWTTSNVTTNALNLTGLLDCTDYEFEVETSCDTSGTSGFSTTNTFTTVCVCADITDLDTVAINSNDVTLNWSATNNNQTYTVGYKLSSASAWNTLSTANISYQLTGLTPGELYDARVQITCTDGGQSGFSNVKTFRTDWSVSTNNLPQDIEHLAIYPNPFTENVNVQINIANSQEVNVEVYDITGKVMQARIVQLNAGENTVNLTMNNLVDGVYIIRLTTENGVAARRVVKQ